jgi:hypothetical protein
MEPENQNTGYGKVRRLDRCGTLVCRAFEKWWGSRSVERLIPEVLVTEVTYKGSDAVIGLRLVEPHHKRFENSASYGPGLL